MYLDPILRLPIPCYGLAPQCQNLGAEVLDVLLQTKHHIIDDRIESWAFIVLIQPKVVIPRLYINMARKRKVL